MKKMAIAAALLSASALSQAEHKDIIAFKMTGECSWGEYMKVVEDFNGWANPRGYNAQIFMPHDDSDLETYYWVGTSADFAAFGTAYDEWMAGLMAGDSEPQKLNDRFAKCVVNHSRSSYVAF
ncbi:hypothetical protein [Pseudohaliea sp.]|uniref:hypothetical protein n=1 Tax=Pseudohaliea sp. TaxID=2740289 RepID=UPI0032EAB7B9